MKLCIASVAVATGLSLAASANALTNLVKNGNFTQTTGGADGQINFNGFQVNDWIVPGTAKTSYTFLYKSGSADRLTGANAAPDGVYGINALWGPNDGSANGLPASSPQGGNFIAQDGAFQLSPIEQTVTGLTMGDKYTLTFDYGFAQQQGFNGATIQDWAVSLGAQTLTTPQYNLPSHGFSGWQTDSMTFTATSSSEVLSFMAYGSQQVPPFALLDGVRLVKAIPEPADWTLMLVGVSAVGGVARARRRRASSAIA